MTEISATVIFLGLLLLLGVVGAGVSALRRAGSGASHPRAESSRPEHADEERVQLPASIFATIPLSVPLVAVGVVLLAGVGAGALAPTMVFVGLVGVGVFCAWRKGGFTW